MRRRQALLSLLLPLLASLVLPPLTAQQKPDDSPFFVEAIDVRVVNLEVVVEDGAGKRVTGLEPGDFRLRVNGQEVAIDYFSEVVDGTATRPDAADVESLPQTVSGRPVGTSYLVFIDDYFATKADRNRALAGIAGELSRLGPDDRMAIVAFDGHRLDMLSSWNGSPAVLQEVLEKAQQRPAHGLRTGLFLRQAQSTGIVGFDVVRDLEEKVESISLAVTATLRSFANPPGRKVMLLVSGGWPHSPARFVTSSITLYDRRGEGLLHPIFQTANLLGYTLYPIDAPGLRSSGLGLGGPDLVSRRVPERPLATNVREDEVHDSLRILAAETGGRALLDGARNTAFDRVIADTRTYYWLGFIPEWQSDGRSHDVDVEVLRPGLKVRTRKGYRDYTRSQEVSFMVESALLFGDLPGAQPLAVEVGTPDKSFRRAALPLELSFPLDEVTAFPAGGRYVIQLELRIVAIDAKGHRSDVDLLPVRLDGSRPPSPGQIGTAEVTVQMRRGTERLVVALHDPLSGKIFSSTVVLGR